mgnify:CR=1 FL=1
MDSALGEHEAANRNRQNAPASEVRAASRALLEQHIEMCRAQQQSAAGALGASIAHKIAGMAMDRASLRDGLIDSELIKRAELVVKELNRVKRLCRSQDRAK